MIKRESALDVVENDVLQGTHQQHERLHNMLADEFSPMKILMQNPNYLDVSDIQDERMTPMHDKSQITLTRLPKPNQGGQLRGAALGVSSGSEILPYHPRRSLIVGDKADKATSQAPPIPHIKITTAQTRRPTHQSLKRNNRQQALDFLLGRPRSQSNLAIKQGIRFSKLDFHLVQHEPLLVYQCYRYLCANCSKIFQKLLIVEDTLNNMMIDKYKRDQAIELTKKMHDLFKGTQPSGIKCPYCEEPAYLLLSSSLLIGEGGSNLEDDMRHNDVQQCCCQASLNIEKVNNEDTSQQQNKNSLLQPPQGTNQDRRTTYQYFESNQQQLQSPGPNNRLNTDVTLQEINMPQINATLEVNLSVIDMNNQRPQQLQQQDLIQESRQSYSTFQKKSIKNASTFQDIATSEVLLKKEKPIGMHVIKSSQEKIVDMKQQIKTVRVLYLGDATLAGVNNPTIQKTTAATSTDSNHVQTQNCCQQRHFLPPEQDPMYKADKYQCAFFNKKLMRHLLEQKMQKNKSFYEMKLITNAQVEVPKITDAQKKLSQGMGVREGNILFQKLNPKEDE